MDSILNWYREEGIIFKGGSGAGVNLSSIRASVERLQGGGTASGPVTFMRGADASAGTIKSGGKTRRAAKMVILDADHPDIEDFIWCKALEERKARVLRDAGFDMDLDGATRFDPVPERQQLRTSHRRVHAGGPRRRDWALTAGSRLGGRTVKARDLFRQIAHAAWECADPGMQFDTTINRWHTAPNAGRINGSNPCSAYLHLDNSACNLGEPQPVKDLGDDDTFDTESFKATVDVVFTAQEILVGNADYPTEKSAATSRRYRELGLGYATSAPCSWPKACPTTRTRARLGGGDHRPHDRPRVRGLRTHRLGWGRSPGSTRRRRDARSAADAPGRGGEDRRGAVPTELLSAAQEAWDAAVELAEPHGVRNSQATVLAPTGTIALLMDCDTTGIEPDLGLVKTKKLVGGGTMSIVNQTVPRALSRLGYSTRAGRRDRRLHRRAQVDRGRAAPSGGPSPGVRVLDGGQHDPLPGSRPDDGGGQPFITGAISKTVNMPEEVTVEDVEQLHIDAWRLGIKAVAIYRDNCKVAQPLATTKMEAPTVGTARRGPRGRGPEPGARGADRRARGGADPRAGPDGRAPRGRGDPGAPAPTPPLQHLRLPGRRLRGLRHRGRVRGRPAR